jgi:hypothetical protein
MSRGRGVTVVELDMQFAFTAARARNAGIDALLASTPSIDKVFFVDGDCEVISGWLATAVQFLDDHPDVAVVSGRRRERYPDKSIYNMLCAMEWEDCPFGETTFCGGDAVIRVRAFRGVNGFRPDLICGEEPELCVRLRRAGWKVWRLDEEMTLHDAAIYRFGQWWKRTMRAGYAFAQGGALHGSSPQRHWVRESRRAWIWGLWIPIVVLTVSLLVGWPGLLLLLVYPLQVFRVAFRGRRAARLNLIQAVAHIFGRFPELLGALKFTLDRWRNLQPRIIEYK